MPQVHCVGDARSCGAVTVAQGNTDVYVNGKLWAVEGDPNSHGGGALISSGATSLEIHGRRVIVKGDHAAPDSQCPIVGPPHCDPIAVEASADVAAGI